MMLRQVPDAGRRAGAREGSGGPADGSPVLDAPAGWVLLLTQPYNLVREDTLACRTLMKQLEHAAPTTMLCLCLSLSTGTSPRSSRKIPSATGV